MLFVNIVTALILTVSQKIASSDEISADKVNESLLAENKKDKDDDKAVAKKLKKKREEKEKKKKKE
jgi:hypothetical protein